MKVRYEFANGEVSEIEVDDSLGELLMDFDRQEYNNDHKETRRHVSLDGMDYEGELFLSPADTETEVLQREKLARLMGAMVFSTLRSPHGNTGKIRPSWTRPLLLPVLPSSRPAKPINFFIPFLARKIEVLKRSTTLPSCAIPRRSWHSGRTLPLAYGPPLATASPIEGLTEATNETAKTGQITGSLADALNWAGVSEDGRCDRRSFCCRRRRPAGYGTADDRAQLGLHPPDFSGALQSHAGRLPRSGTDYYCLGVPRKAARLCGERRSSVMNELLRLRGSERYGACDDERRCAFGLSIQRNYFSIYEYKGPPDRLADGSEPSEQYGNCPRKSGPCRFWGRQRRAIYRRSLQCLPAENLCRYGGGAGSGGRMARPYGWHKAARIGRCARPVFFRSALLYGGL